MHSPSSCSFITRSSGPLHQPFLLPGNHATSSLPGWFCPTMWSRLNHPKRAHPSPHSRKQLLGHTLCSLLFGFPQLLPTPDISYSHMCCCLWARLWALWVQTSSLGIRCCSHCVEYTWNIIGTTYIFVVWIHSSIRILLYSYIKVWGQAFFLCGSQSEGFSRAVNSCLAVFHNPSVGSWLLWHLQNWQCTFEAHERILKL